MSSKMTASLAAIVLLPLLSGADAPGRRADQEALGAYGKLVGDWRGTGQLRRGSAQGSWTEGARWAWKLSADAAALELTVTKGKHLRSALLRPDPGADAKAKAKAGSFVLDAVLDDGTSRTFRGAAAARDVLALTADGPPGDGVRRVTLSPLHDTRVLMLLEGQSAADGPFFRLAEVGFTRQGVAFAVGESYPLCIVTDGRGTSTVTYKGMTYPLCCSGCKALFEDDPDGVIAEALERRKAK